MVSGLDRGVGQLVGTAIVVGGMLAISNLASRYEIEAMKYREKNPGASTRRVLKHMLYDGIENSYGPFIERMTKNKKEGLRWWTKRVNNNSD